MKKILVSVIVLLGLGAVAFVGYRAGWFARFGADTAPGAGPTATLPGDVAAPTSAPSAAATEPAPAGSAQPLPAAGVPDLSTSAPLVAPSAYTPVVDLASADLGGRVENAKAQYELSANNLIDGNPATSWWSGWDDSSEFHWVISFLNREAAVISGVVFNQPSPQSSGAAEQQENWVKDVEIWVAMDEPKDGFSAPGVPKGTPPAGFTRVATASLRAEPGDQSFTFAPVQARFVVVRVLSKQTPGIYVSLGKVRIIESHRAGYVPLLERYPGFSAMRSGQTPWDEAAKAAVAATPSGASPGASAGPACAPVENTTRTPPKYPESRNVLVVSETPMYRPATFAQLSRDPESKPQFEGIDTSIYDRLRFMFVSTVYARPAMLLNVDTVALVAQCQEHAPLPAAFKRALASWVADGHKLIIQDSDWCGGEGSVIDYRFLPFPFATSNPGAQGAKSDRLFFVEENTLGNGRRGDVAFVDIKAWLNSDGTSRNELGDSNTIVQYDPHWCGHLFGTNVLKKYGFMEAYARYGRGLIIYNGFDLKEDQGRDIHQLITRELAQPFDPDGLPCSVPLGDFIITTEPRLLTQTLVPGNTYTYPLSLLSNQGYQGRVTLAATANPSSPALGFNVQPAAVDVSDISKATLTVTTTRTTPVADHMVTVRGTDAAGKTNVMCLSLGPPRSGTLQVVSALPRPSKPTKNLEIILDASGSMKTALGKSTRMTTAREVLRNVVTRIPDDFNVGLRFYGHRYGSRQKETCTDSELVRPIEKLDRNDLLAKVDAVQPRGETPLIYSLLQTPADLKEVGGGSVILVTDGEESCGGDPVAAAKQLKGTGVDVTLNIVGFTLKGKTVEQQLSTLAESTGGRYYSAQSGEALAQALLIAAIDRIPYTVFDASGKQVATGEAGGLGTDLPPGEYRVVAAAADQQLVADKVTVAAGVDVVLKVVVKNDRLTLGQ